jgi:hypothetical protein
MSLTIERRPQCQVTLARGTAKNDRGGFSRLGTFMASADGEKRIPVGQTNLTGRVLRARTVKSIGSPMGSFEVGFTFQGLDRDHKAALYKLLTPDNLLLLDFNAGLPGSSMTRVMEGWISNVSERTAVSRGVPQRELVVSGHDAGKFLVRHELPGHLLTAFIQGQSEETRRLSEGLTVFGPPGQVLRQLFSELFLRLVPAPQVIQRRSALLTHPALEPSHVHFPPDALKSFISPQSVWTKHGKFWSLFRCFLDAPWNEAFTDFLPVEHLTRVGVPGMERAADDVAPFGDYVLTTANPDLSSADAAAQPRAGFYIVARPQPFSPDAWRGLPRTTIRDSEIMVQQTRLSDDERVNLVYVRPLGVASKHDDYFQGLKYKSLLFDRDNAERHGTQILQASTIYSDIDGTAHSDPDEVRKANSGTGLLYNALATRAERLWDWYSVNAEMWKGAFVIAGRPDVRIGERVSNQHEPSAFFDPNEYERRDYYCERVIQDFVEGSHYRTHLAVTRGQPLGTVLQAVTPERVRDAA